MSDNNDIMEYLTGDKDYTVIMTNNFNFILGVYISVIIIRPHKRGNPTNIVIAINRRLFMHWNEPSAVNTVRGK